ncbi:hypothetical protein, partial [Streptococcus pneumoniae]|uniref:hypothetical protein n=1 Tax=Streptococcus pneumoniae TaxID=1313 RepID=UPI001E428BDC
PITRAHNGSAFCPILEAEFTLNGHKFRLLNDDGDIDYEGIMTHELADSPDILAPLDDFAMPNVGSTTLQLWSNVSEKWESVN